MDSASSSKGRRRSPRLEKKVVSGSDQSSWNPDRLDQEDATNSPLDEPLPIVRVLLRKMKVSKEGISQDTEGEARVRGNPNRMNAVGNTQAHLDDSVIELDQDEHSELDHEVYGSRHDLDRNDRLPLELENEARVGPSSMSGSGVMERISGGGGPLPGPSHSQTETEMEDVITIDDEEEEDQGQSSDEDIMILSQGPQVAAQDTNNPDSMNDVSDNSHEGNENDFTIEIDFITPVTNMPLGNENDATINIDLTTPVTNMPSRNDSDNTIDIDLKTPVTHKVRAAGSSSKARSAPESSSAPVALSREPLTCPICFESYVALCKGKKLDWNLIE